MKISKLLFGGTLFKKAFRATKRDVFVSLCVLVILSVLCSLLLWVAEWNHTNYSIGDALLWPFVVYIDNPAEIGIDPPITGLGKFIGSLVGIIGIAIFAVPTGLIGSGLIDAMNEQKHEKELEEMRERIRKAFLRDTDKVLGDYLKRHPDDRLGKNDLFFVPQEIPVYKMQARQNMDLKDIIDCCKKFPEIRLKNVAQSKADADAHFVVEYAPLTDKACYGCFIPRDSKVTIVSTSSYAEKGTGWFAYYLAKLGGFNFLSKDLEVDYDDQDPYFNMNPEPLHDMKNLSENTEKRNKKAIEKINKKQEFRNSFISDITSCCQGQDTWVIIVKHHLKSATDSHDFHFNCSGMDGKNSTVNDVLAYEQLITDFTQTMENEKTANEEHGLTTMCDSSFYSLKNNEKQKNLAYFIRERAPQTNVFVLRPGSDVMNLNERKLVIAYKMARLISQHLDGGRGPINDDLNDLQQLDFAFAETQNHPTSKK